MEAFIVEYFSATAAILFTMGALVVSETGKIFYGSLLYLTGDILLLIYSWLQMDWFTIVTFILAVVFSFRTIYKMHRGRFLKDLKNESKWLRGNNV